MGLNKYSGFIIDTLAFSLLGVLAYIIGDTFIYWNELFITLLLSLLLGLVASLIINIIKIKLGLGRDSLFVKLCAPTRGSKLCFIIGFLISSVSLTLYAINNINYLRMKITDDVKMLPFSVFGLILCILFSDVFALLIQKIMNKVNHK